MAFRASIRRSLTTQYLAGTKALTQRLIGGRSGERDFRRVVVVAALGRNNGIAGGARLQVEALRRQGVDADLLDATPALRNPLVRIPHPAGTAYVFHAGGPQTASLIGSVLPDAANAWRIAYWAWELPDPPLDWCGCDRNVNEIWTPSGFAQSSLARLTARPVHVVPHWIEAKPARQRRYDQPFTVLTFADSRSSLSRKNPAAAVKAFRTAFGGSPAARLVVKLSGPDDELRPLMASLGPLVQGGNVSIVNRRLDDAELAALYRGSDVLLSLHRAEGFGMPMAEAMAHGVPVVATGWSGNLTFMSEADSYLVQYALVPVEDAAGIYSGSIWADPDVDDAADALRYLADHPRHYARLAAAAHRRASAAAPCFPFAGQRRAAGVPEVAVA